MCARASYKTMVLYEAMGIKSLIQLSIKKIIDKKMKSWHEFVHNVFTDEEIETYQVKA